MASIVKFSSLSSCAIRERAIQAVSELINDASSRRTDVALISFGLAGLEAWVPFKSLEVLVVGTMSANTFFEMMQEKLEDSSAQDTPFSYPADNSADSFQLSVYGVKLQLSYISSETILRLPRVGAVDSVWEAVFDYLAQAARWALRRRFEPTLYRGHPDIEAWSLAYCKIRQWAWQAGILADEGFGYLTDASLVTLCVNVLHLCKDALRNLSTGAVDVKVDYLTRAFFSEYASIDFNTCTISDPTSPPSSTKVVPGRERKPLEILNLRPPFVNTASKVNEETQATISKEIQRMYYQQLMDADAFSAFLEHESAGLDRFTSDYSLYVKIHIGHTSTSNWDLVEQDAIKLTTTLCSPRISARLWPARLMNSGSELAIEQCYLVGIDTKSSTVHDGRASILDTIVAFNKKKSQDPALSSVHAVLCDAVTDSTELKVTAAKTFETFSPPVRPTDSTPIVGTRPGQRMDSERNPSTLPSPPPPPESTKPKRMRTETDVYSRLVWDHDAYDTNDILIGYEDRHDGMMVLPFNVWKRDTTEDEFIPMHRIRYYKKKSTGEVLWDRFKKIDRVFKSV